MSKKAITEKDSEQVKWYKDAKRQTMDTLPAFIAHLLDDYKHDYGTICHALTAGGIATMSAMNHHPSGGITGFQAGCIMWEFIRHWNRENNKTGMRLVDYDNMLYPQYEDDFQKTITPSTWEAIQREAKNSIKKADREHAKYVADREQYEKDIAAFVAKYPDYYDRKEHYDHLGTGTGAEWDAYHAKEESGFEFAPREPYEPISKGNSVVYSHWEDIVAGAVPFGYRVAKDR